MTFNPNTVRNEMNNFWDILFSPVAISKFLHTIVSGYDFFLIFFLGFMSWILLKDGFSVDVNGLIFMKEYKYLQNF